MRDCDERFYAKNGILNACLFIFMEYFIKLHVFYTKQWRPLWQLCCLKLNWGHGIIWKRREQNVEWEKVAGFEKISESDSSDFSGDKFITHLW